MNDQLLRKDIILNARTPLLMKNFKHNWNCFLGCNLEDWCSKLDAYSKVPLKFESMSIYNNATPQWERCRKNVNITAKEFLRQNYLQEDQEYWTAFQYKRINELPTAVVEDVDFACFGFPTVKRDSTLWLSSKGANTPCHYDTYGVNIVVQIYGKKSWLLYPPETQLTTTRVPYEESSVYCLENVHSPTSRDITKLLQFKDNVYYVELEPRDVLIIPRHWWHFVETNETSLSINAWIPLNVDIESQIEECILKYIIESIVRKLPESLTKYVMNPNQISQIVSEEQILQILRHLLIQKNLCQNSVNSKQSYPYHYLTEHQYHTLLNTTMEFLSISKLHHNQYEYYIKVKQHRYNAEFAVELKPNDSPLNQLQNELINSICTPTIIRAIKNNLLSRLEHK